MGFTPQAIRHVCPYWPLSSSGVISIWVGLSLEVASWGTHTLGTFQKHPLFSPPSTTSGTLYAYICDLNLHVHIYVLACIYIYFFLTPGSAHSSLKTHCTVVKPDCPQNPAVVIDRYHLLHFPSGNAGVSFLHTDILGPPPTSHTSTHTPTRTHVCPHTHTHTHTHTCATPRRCHELLRLLLELLALSRRVQPVRVQLYAALLQYLQFCRWVSMADV